MSKHVVLALALFACGKGTPASDGKPSAPIDTGAVNALVPAALKPKLTFEKREVVLKRGKSPTKYTVAAPKDWKQQSEMFGDLQGGMDGSFSVGPDCGGECKEKDWAAVSDKFQFQPIAQGKVIKDEKKPGQRLMVASDESTGMKRTTVLRAWWVDGDKQYHYCKAEIFEALLDAEPAFEKACSNVTIDGED